MDGHVQHDGFGRDINYLRIAVTDKCNFRCIYCMPADGVAPRAHDELLSAEEIARFVRLCDCYNIPVVTLVNTAGQTTVDETNNAPSIAAAAELIYAYAEAVVPKVSVLCGQAVGAAYAAMGSKGNGADVVYA